MISYPTELFDLFRALSATRVEAARQTARQSLLGALLALPCAGALGADFQPISTVPEGNPKWTALGDQIGDLLQASPNSAATLIIVDNNAIALRRDYLQRPLEHLSFRLGSITKTFTALALIHAAAATNTPLDTPLANIIDPALWKNPWRTTHPVQLDQLIELSAGFADISAAEFANAKPLPSRQALELDAASHISHWPPGLQHSYTNLAPAYSAMAIEALTDQPFETYLTQHVFKALEMPTATLQPLVGLPGGFQNDGITPIPYWHTLFPAFGGLNAEPGDMANFLLRLTRNDFGPALNAALRHRGSVPLWQPTSTAAARAGLAHGYGAGIYATVRDKRLIYGHGGDADGYRSRFGVVAGSTRGYFIAINSDNPLLLRRLQATVERVLVTDPGAHDAAPEPQTAPFAALSAAQRRACLQRFAGEYYPASKRFGLGEWQTGGSQKAQVSVAREGLELRRGGTITPLIWLGESLFRRPQDPTATVVFVSANNQRYMQGELGNWLQIQSTPLHASGPSGAY